jgi:hypothetical protein
MAWPLASHFSAMLQTPKLAFRDAALQTCRVEKDAMNQPRPWSGSFAVVYKGINVENGRPFAIRVFTTESPERRERYDRISEYLRTHKLPCLVDFEYRDRSIRSAGDGKFYPLILMDWVQGDTVFNWARGRCTAGDGAALAEVAQRWLVTVKELADARVCHGDIQHGNIMITDAGDIRLVDYDGMCVPGLVGRRNLEVGVDPYQHPGRGPTTVLSLELDRYSTIVVYVALRALAAAPDLWEKHVERVGSDRLLFRKEDLRSASRSALYLELKKSPDPDVRNMIDQLIDVTQAPIERVPPLVQFANCFARVEELLERKQWSEAVKLLNRRGRFDDAPAELKPRIGEAYERALRDEAWQAFVALPRDLTEQCDRALVRAWNEALFANQEHVETERSQVAAASERILVLKQMARGLRQSTGTMSLEAERAVVGLAERLPEGYRHSLEQRVLLAQRRCEAIDRLQEAIAAGTDEAAIVSAWEAIAETGCGPMVTDPSVRLRHEQARSRIPLLESLRRLSLDAVPEQVDRQLLAIWREELLGKCMEAEPWRKLYQRAVHRRKLLAELQSAIDHRDDPEIAALVSDPALEGYPLPAQWSTTIRGARNRASLCNLLLGALGDGQRGLFVERFDAPLIRRQAQRFLPYAALIGDWVRADVLPLPNIGLGPAVGRANISRLEEHRGVLRVRWTWPLPRIADECLLAVCRSAPGATDLPSDVQAVYRSPIERTAWESGGGSRVIEPLPEWEGFHLVVWARVDLGFASFYSQPLVLGVLEADRGWMNWLGLSRPSVRAEPGREVADG